MLGLFPNQQNEHTESFPRASLAHFARHLKCALTQKSEMHANNTCLLRTAYRNPSVCLALSIESHIYAHQCSKKRKEKEEQNRESECLELRQFRMRVKSDSCWRKPIWGWHMSQLTLSTTLLARSTSQMSSLNWSRSNSKVNTAFSPKRVKLLIWTGLEPVTAWTI